MNACTIFGCAGSLVPIPCKPRYVQTGDRLPNILRPVNRKPPSTLSALVVDSSTGMSFRVRHGRRRKPPPSRPPRAATERRVAGAPKIGGQAGPVQVHVDGQGRRGRVIRESALFADDLGQRQAESAKFVGNREAQVARLAQLLEVLRKKGVLLVVAPGPRREAVQQLVGQERLMGAGCLGGNELSGLAMGVIGIPFVVRSGLRRDGAGVYLTKPQVRSERLIVGPNAGAFSCYGLSAKVRPRWFPRDSGDPTRRIAVRIAAGPAVLAIGLAIAGTSARGQGDKPGAMVEWKTYGGDLASLRYSPLDQINTDNFSKLQVAWRLNTDAFGPRPDFLYSATPLMVGGVLYTTVGHPPRRRGARCRDRRAALDARRGRRPARPERPAHRRRPGRCIWSSADGSDQRIIYVTPGYRMIALNARTGVPVERLRPRRRRGSEARQRSGSRSRHRGARPERHAARRGRRGGRRRRPWGTAMSRRRCATPRATCAAST